MQALMEVRPILGFGHHVNGVCVGIDYRRTHDTDIRTNVAGIHISTVDPRFAAGQQTLGPIRLARRGIRVEGVDGVVLRCRDDYVVSSSADVDVSYPQRLCVCCGVDGTGETLAERGSLHRRSIQRIFLAVHAIPGQIVVIREYTGEVGDRNAGSGRDC